MAGKAKVEEKRTKSPTKSEKVDSIISKGESSTKPEPKRRGRPKSPARSSPARTKSPARASPARTKSPARASPARTKSPIQPKSPARTKSPSRGPGRPRKSRSKSPVLISPIRKSPPRKSPARKSPSRQSPARVVKENKVVKEVITRSEKWEGKIQSLDLDTDSDSGDRYDTKIEKPKATVRGRTRRTDFDEYEKEIEDVKEVTNSYRDFSSGIVRRSARLQEEKLLPLKNYEAYTKLSEFSDEDEVTTRTEATSMSPPKKTLKFNYLGRVASFLGLVSLPFVYIMIYMMCNEDHCSFRKLPNMEKYKKLGTYFDLFSFLIVIGYTLFIAIISALPFGGKRISGIPNRHGKLDYVINGWLSAIILSSSLVLSEYFKVPATKYIQSHLLQLSVASTLVGLFFSIYLYIKSYYAPLSALNGHALTEDKIYNFIIGRETNPRLFGALDLKYFFFRFFCVGALLINICFVYESLGVGKLENASLKEPMTILKSLDINPTLLSIVFMQMVIIIDYFFCEDCVATTFENQYEGLGYMLCLFYTYGAFFYTHITKYVLDYDVQLTKLQLALCFVTFIVGFGLSRLSNLQKDTFRRNPYHPKVAHLESIPTGQGKKLLVSGFWGFVRHPNYLGDILVYTSWIPFAMCYPPVLVPLSNIAQLIHRSTRDHKRCKERYGNAWDRYCNKVKYVLIPKLY